MKRERAVHHLKALVESCTDMQTMLPATAPLRVVQLWALGRVLEAPAELDVVQVALVVDLPVDDVPWLDEPNTGPTPCGSTRTRCTPTGARRTRRCGTTRSSGRCCSGTRRGGGEPASPAVPDDGVREGRWAPGRLEPTADALWRVSAGYVDVLGALERPTG